MKIINFLSNNAKKTLEEKYPEVFEKIKDKESSDFQLSEDLSFEIFICGSSIYFLPYIGKKNIIKISYSGEEIFLDNK